MSFFQIFLFSYLFFTTFSGGLFLLIFQGRGVVLPLWIRLELIIWGILVIYLISNKSLKSNREIIFKYFLIQRVRSLFWMGRFFFSNFSVYPDRFWKILSEVIFFLPLLLKRGVFPFHAWLLEVVNLNLPLLTFLILGIQKIPVIFILIKWIFFFRNFSVIKFFIFLNIRYVILGFLNFSDLFSYMFFSRIYHLILFFLIVESLGSELGPALYFFSYLLFFFIFIVFLRISFLRRTQNIPHHIKEWGFFFIILSIRGFPPYIIFFPKLLFFNLIWFIMGDFFLIIILIPVIAIYLITFLFFLLKNIGRSRVKLYNYELGEASQEVVEVILFFFQASIAILFYLFI